MHTPRNAHHHWRMSPAERTFGHEFNENRYHTGYIGKWHLADVGRNRPVPKRFQGGFDHWRGFELKNDPFDTSYYAGGDSKPRPIDGYQTDGRSTSVQSISPIMTPRRRSVSQSRSNHLTPIYCARKVPRTLGGQIDETTSERPVSGIIAS